MTVKIKRNFDILITPEECGVIFSSMDSDEQAVFFNAVGQYFTGNYKHGLCWQLSSISSCLKLTDEGRRVMSMIGEHADE